jgi:hypothetical protein
VARDQPSSLRFPHFERPLTTGSVAVTIAEQDVAALGQLRLRRAPGQLRGGPGRPRPVRGGAARPAGARQRGRLPSHPRELLDLPVVGDVRGDGYFHGLELVEDRATEETFDAAESERLLRGFLSGALFEAGLSCRADDRGDPVVQLAPPLIRGQAEFDEMEQVLRSVLTEAWARL